MLDNYRELQERYQFQMGTARGGIATALDMLTDALALVGQHGVYCHSQRDPTKPTMDIQIITDELRKAKERLRHKTNVIAGCVKQPGVY